MVISSVIHDSSTAQYSGDEENEKAARSSLVAIFERSFRNLHHISSTVFRLRRSICTLPTSTILMGAPCFTARLSQHRLHVRRPKRRSPTESGLLFVERSVFCSQGSLLIGKVLCQRLSVLLRVKLLAGHTKQDIVVTLSIAEKFKFTYSNLIYSRL